MTQYVKFLAMSCPHFPYQDKAGVTWLIKEISDYKPEVIVLLGDVCDTECLSRFAKQNAISLEQEYQAGDKCAETIHDHAHGAKIIWMQGNHEERCFRPDYSALSELIDYRIHVKASSKWTHYPYELRQDKCFSIGQVTFAHGWNTNDASIKKETIILGVPNGLYIHGHTHRPHCVKQVKMGAVDLPYWYANTGTFIQTNPKPEYMKKRDDHQWGQGLVIGHANPKRRWGHKCDWAARLLLRKMAWWKGEKTRIINRDLITPQYGPS